MPGLANIVRVLSSTTSTGTLTLGSAVQGFLTPSQAGMIDGQLYTYCIEADYVTVGDDLVPTSREVGIGTYTASSNQLSRANPPYNSTNSNALLNLSGDEQVIIAVAAASVRELLVNGRTYYVRTDGSDSNSGLVNSAGGAFLTIQKAFDTVSGKIDFGGQPVFIQVGNGTYSAGGSLQGWVGGGQLIIQGDTTTPANVAISQSTAATPFGAIFDFPVPCAGLLILKGFKMTTTSSGRAHVYIRSPGVSMQLNSNEHAGVPASTFTGAISMNSGGSYIQWGGPNTISGSMPTWLSVVGPSYVESFSQTVTITGTPNFDWQGVFASKGAICYLNPITFSGSATGVRYFATQNGIIDTGGLGATFLPGNTAGSVSAQGQYL